MKHFKKLIGPYCVFLFVLTLIPMFLILLYACVEQGTSITTFSFTIDNFLKFFDPIFVTVLVRSFVLGITTTVICLIIGYPIAYAITKFRSSVQTILILLITFPTWINLLMRTYAWISLLSKNGIINNMLAYLNLPVFDMLYTDFAVIIGMVYNFLPFMILPIYTVISKMDGSLIEASNDLGASPMETFCKITLPLSFSGVVTGITMVFLPAVSSFIIPKLLGGGQYTLIGSFIETQFITIGNWHFGSAISLILAVLVIISMACMYMLEKYADSSVIAEDK